MSSIKRPMGAEFLHANRQTDVMKLLVAFCYSAKALKSQAGCHFPRHMQDCKMYYFL